MLKKVSGALMLLISIVSVDAQSFQKTKSGIKATINAVDVEIVFYTPSIVRVSKAPGGSNVQKQSLAVIKDREAVELSIKSQDNLVSVASKDLEADLDLVTGKVEFKTISGKSLLTEKGYGIQFTPLWDFNKGTYDVRQAFLLDKDEIIYGLGQQQNGRLNQRGQKVWLHQGNTRVCIPFFQSVKGYGLYWDNYGNTTFTDNQQETSFDSELGDIADYYFMYGGGSDGVVAKMRELTGQAPLMPLWTYGFNQSRERYKTQFELMDVVKKYRSIGVPLDGIIQDWQYWGKDSNWNAMSFDSISYPKPKAMIDSVHQLNAHLFIVAWPGFGPQTKQFADFKEKKFLIDFDTWPPNSGAKPYDVYNPAARDLYWNYLNKGIFSLGSDAWWLDSTEPDHLNTKDEDWNQQTYLGTYAKFVNAFPLMHTKGVYEHQRSTTNDKRVVLLTRSAFAGQQRFGASTWSGDVWSSWGTLKVQIPAALNFSLTGLPYWNGDIGGFFAQDFMKGGGAKNPEYQELYVRWLQFASLTPMMRSHGTGVPREIYQFGQRGDWAFDVQEKFINLRYSLLPYIYSAAWDVTNNGYSFLRPMYAEFPADKKGYDISNQYFFGKSILVIPVTEKGEKSQLVYLPEGASWTDFWTGETVKGGAEINRETPIDMIPLYVKAGSIIPWGPKVQYAEEKKWNNLEVRIYAGADADFTLYEDENNGYNYEKGLHTEVKFHWNDKDKTLTIADRKGNYPGMLKNRKFNIVLVTPKKGIGSQATQKFDESVSYNGNQVIARF